jgi:hypothetical protein
MDVELENLFDMLAEHSSQEQRSAGPQLGFRTQGTPSAAAIAAQEESRKATVDDLLELSLHLHKLIDFSPTKKKSKGAYLHAL